MNTEENNKENAMDTQSWEEAMKQRQEEFDMSQRREAIFGYLIMAAAILFVGSLLFVSYSITTKNAKAAEVKQAEWVANSDYEEVAQQVADYWEEKYRQENSFHPGAGHIRTHSTAEEGPVENNWNCSAWKWKGRVYTAQHCVQENYHEGMGDVVVYADQYPHDITEDLYDVGLECSTDFRWWGATTDMWGHIPFEQVFVHTMEAHASVGQQGALHWAFIEARVALEDKTAKQPEAVFKQLVAAYNSYIASSSMQKFLCAAQHSLEISPDHGDSGGPLLAGDEVIGFVSYAEWPKNGVTGTLEDFEIKYKDALYSEGVDCWGTITRANNIPLPSTEEKTDRYQSLYKEFIEAFGQDTINKWNSK